MNNFELKLIEQALKDTGVKKITKYKNKHTQMELVIALFKYKNKNYTASINPYTNNKETQIQEYTKKLKKLIISQKKKVDRYLYDKLEMPNEANSLDVIMFQMFVKEQMVGFSKMNSKDFNYDIFDTTYHQGVIYKLIKQSSNNLEAYEKIKQDQTVYK